MEATSGTGKEYTELSGGTLASRQCGCGVGIGSIALRRELQKLPSVPRPVDHRMICK
jgi:hypothetical protein